MASNSWKRYLTEADLEQLLYEEDEDTPQGNDYGDSGSEHEDHCYKEYVEKTDSENEEELLYVLEDEAIERLNSSIDEEMPIIETNKSQECDPNPKIESDDDVPLSKLINTNPYIIVPPKLRLKGKNGHRWSSVSRNRVGRKSSKNVVHIRPGPSNNCKNASTEIDIFKLFFDDSIIDTIVCHTNEMIVCKATKYKNQQLAAIQKTNKTEIMALMGLLIFSASMKNNHLKVRQMFDPNISGSVYRSVMSEERFQFLINCLRFDDQGTRPVRKSSDSFAAIRNIWDKFIINCTQNYKPGSYLTIDEQLLGFRGRCPFRMYIPNKPAKYGIKIVMVCDSGSKYMIAASPYLGKSTVTNGDSLGTHYVKELTKSVHGSNRNITMDNWFTSIDLAKTMLGDPYKLTIVGTVRKNKKEIPPELLHLKGRKPKTSMFCFDRDLTLVSFVPKQNKNVLLLSSTHDQPSISDSSKKPIIIEFYNATKGGVDTFDMMCANMSCNRKTRRWPLCIFYNMLNICGINSYIIYNHKKHAMTEKTDSRQQFLYNLSTQLMRPWIEHRANYKNLARPLQKSINAILKPQATTSNGNTYNKGKRTICAICPSKKRRMTTMYCNKCERPICAEHRSNSCFEC